MESPKSPLFFYFKSPIYPKIFFIITVKPESVITIHLRYSRLKPSEIQTDAVCLSN